MKEMPKDGVMNVFCKNTGCGLIIIDTMDPKPEMMYAALDKMVPTIAGVYYMPQFVRGLFTSASISIPITDGKLDLGTYQGVYMAEHNSKRYPKEFLVTVYGTDDTPSDSNNSHKPINFKSIWKTIRCCFKK